MRVKNKRILKNGAIGAYVYYNKEKKWKWRIIKGPSKKKGGAKFDNILNVSTIEFNGMKGILFGEIHKHADAFSMVKEIMEHAIEKKKCIDVFVEDQILKEHSFNPHNIQLGGELTLLQVQRWMKEYSKTPYIRRHLWDVRGTGIKNEIPCSFFMLSDHPLSDEMSQCIVKTMLDWTTYDHRLKPIKNLSEFIPTLDILMQELNENFMMDYSRLNEDEFYNKIEDLIENNPLYLVIQYFKDIYNEKLGSPMVITKCTVEQSWNEWNLMFKMRKKLKKQWDKINPVIGKKIYPHQLIEMKSTAAFLTDIYAFYRILRVYPPKGNNPYNATCGPTVSNFLYYAGEYHTNIILKWFEKLGAEITSYVKYGDLVKNPVSNNVRNINNVRRILFR